jgi:secreted trypsin-like serine protease
MIKTTAAALAALVAAAWPAFADDGVTPLRQKVRNWERAQMQRVLGESGASSMAVQPHIVGGKVAAPKRWPFQVAIMDRSVNRNVDAWFCGGTLVASNFVVTAAHCVKGERPAALDVLTGTQSMKRDAPGGVRIPVAKIIVHPNYRSATADYDIAVIQLQSAASVTGFATLLGLADEARYASPGTDAQVTGWGDLRENAGRYPTELNEVLVPIVSTATCNARGSYNGDVTTRMFCAGYAEGKKDACDGDSGGPLVVQDASGKWTILAGIVSWGEGCARRNLYGVYSRVAVLSNWALSKIAFLNGDRRNADQVSQDCEQMRGSALSACLDRGSLLPQ